jgi:hypothetical protein
MLRALCRRLCCAAGWALAVSAGHVSHWDTRLVWLLFAYDVLDCSGIIPTSPPSYSITQSA